MERTSRFLCALLALALCAGLIGTVRAEPATGDNALSYAGYTLVWEDGFDGEALDRDSWNVELHEPGWVNAELQQYVDSADVIRTEDGALVLQAHKDASGHITSGRVNTRGKRDFTYGLFEARLKVPVGQGYLPAFWLMATDENLYGQWPRCGEIDIMEIMGQEPAKDYATVHFGTPHNQSQGTLTLTEGDFTSDWHVFDLEWEPGSLKWYVDGMLIHEENDWYTAVENQGTVTYPAPFDQPFYVILNLAVGGSWVGYPADDAVIDGEYAIDYVRVYQKDAYDSGVLPPARAAYRNPDATGNYLINSDFSAPEAFNDDLDWILLTAEGGAATAEIMDGALKITSTSAGRVDYGVQLVQSGIPAEQGGTYRVTFDAWTEGEDRTGIVNVDAWKKGWSRYLPDTHFTVTPEKQTFTFEYTVTAEDDPDSRFEFNLGNTSPITPFWVDNLRVEKISQTEVIKKRSMLADGNYVYNGRFQEGPDRMSFWEIEAPDGAEAIVTNEDPHDRRLRITVPEDAASPVIVRQNGLALTVGSGYAVSFDVEGETGRTVAVTAAGEQLDTVLSGSVQTVGSAFTFAADTAADVVFTFAEPGVYFLDNVTVGEDSLIKNGSFSAGLAGYTPYIDSSADADYVVDTLTEDGAFDVTIRNTGDADWKVQLKQENVRLEEGQWYRLTLSMKSTIDREALVAIQRNGNLRGDDWTPYVQEIVNVGAEYQTYVFEFRMNPGSEPKTDPLSVFNVAMGAVGGRRITEQHRICVDNILLEKIAGPGAEAKEEPADTGLLKNGSFADGLSGWLPPTIMDGANTYETGAQGITFHIPNPGTEDWHVQLKQTGLALRGGATYALTFTGSADAARSILVNVMSDDGQYRWYGGTAAALGAEPQRFSFTFTMAEDDPAAAVYVSLGSPVNGVAQPAADVTLTGFALAEAK